MMHIPEDASGHTSTAILAYAADRLSLQPERWSGPSREWVTVTPLMLDLLMTKPLSYKERPPETLPP